MSVEQARQTLIELEADAAASRMEELREQARKVLQALELEETVSNQRKLDIREARKELARQEQLLEAADQAEDDAEDVERLRAKFIRKARGRVWYEGTGNNDAVMAHQLQAMMFGAVAKRWILADGPGLGKTRTTVGWLDLIDAKKIVIVCEANICAQFAGEVMELAPDREVFDISKKSPALRHEMLDSALSMDSAVIVVNFEIWRRDNDVLAKLMTWHADTVIVDEAHNLKTTSSANFGYVKMLIGCDNICPNCRGHIYGLYDPVALNSIPSRKIPRPCPTCEWKIGMPLKVRVDYANKLEQLLVTRSVKNVCFTTGTPILNDPTDLYSMLHLANPLLFPTKAGFQKTYLMLDHMSNKWGFRTGGLKNLKPLISGLFLARTKDDIGLVLPTQRVHHIPVALDKVAYAKQYRTIKQISEAAEIQLDSGEKLTIMHLMSLITRKRQANVWAGGIKMYDRKQEPRKLIFDASTEVQESVKLDVIQEKILELHNGTNRQIVFSQFKTGLEEFAKRLEGAGLRVARMDGDTDEQLRLAIKRNLNRSFGEAARWDVVLANYKTGGTGLNFTAATVTHVLDEEWNPGKRDQAYHRTDRIGQTEENEVFVYRIVGTIDTWMANTIARKERMVAGFTEEIIESPEAVINSLKEAMMSGEIL